MLVEILRLTVALALGLGIGLLYDLLRPLRRTLRPVSAVFIDLLFTSLVCFGVFSYGMSADEGLIGFWELTAILLGFSLYIQLLSDFFYSLFSSFFEGLCSMGRLFILKLKKSVALTKKYFKKVRECFIIRK